MTSSSQRDALHRKVDRLTDQGVEVVSRVADAILTPVNAELLPGSWLTTPTWSDAFLARLRAHHALSREPLSTTQFEAAFEDACEASGWTVAPARSATQRFFDTVITSPAGTSKAISLKASSAAGLRREWVHISKLTEAAWIQDTRRQSDRRDKLVELFQDYRAATDCIVMLRGFVAVGGVDYELLEIPTSLFSLVDNLDVATAQLSTIGLPTGVKPPHFKIRVDRSDAKITLTGIHMDVCRVHGRWTVASH